MLPPDPTEWPIRPRDPWQAPRSPVAPLRHDLALALYLEKQAAHRASTPHRFNPWTAAMRLRVLAAYVGRAVSSARARRGPSRPMTVSESNM